MTNIVDVELNHNVLISVLACYGRLHVSETSLILPVAWNKILALYASKGVSAYTTRISISLPIASRTIF